jgi:hypothetical protein
MYLDELTVGNCRIYGAASPAPGGGYFAGVAVHRMREPRKQPERVYFDDAPYDRSVFVCPKTALRHAMERGQQAAQDLGDGCL